MAPLQALSRRFWIMHVFDEDAEIKSGSRAIVTMLRAVLAGDADAAERAAVELNDSLVAFARATLE